MKKIDIVYEKYVNNILYEEIIRFNHKPKQFVFLCMGSIFFLRMCGFIYFWLQYQKPINFKQLLLDLWCP